MLTLCGFIFCNFLSSLSAPLKAQSLPSCLGLLSKMTHPPCLSVCLSEPGLIQSDNVETPRSCPLVGKMKSLFLFSRPVIASSTCFVSECFRSPQYVHTEHVDTLTHAHTGSHTNVLTGRAISESASILKSDAEMSQC